MNYVIYCLIGNTLSWLTKPSAIQWTKLITQVPETKNKNDRAENPETNTNTYWVNDKNDISSQQGKNGLFNK